MSNSSQKTTKRQEENLRHRLVQSAAKIIPRVEQCALGELEMKPTEMKAADAILQRTVPTLQSTEMVHRDEPQNREEMEQRLTQLILGKPELLITLAKQQPDFAKQLAELLHDKEPGRDNPETRTSHH